MKIGAPATTARSLDLEGCVAVPYGLAHTLLHLDLKGYVERKEPAASSQ
jgi:hypothetical protein